MNNFLKTNICGKAWISLHSKLSKFGRFLLILVCGSSECLACGKASFSVPVCADCYEKLKNYVELNSTKRCSKCGKTLVSEIDLCLECREHPLLSSLDALYPLHSYRQWKKDFVFAWKMEGQRRLSPLLASLLYKALCELGFQKLPVVPVPPRPGKLKQEGWDQIAELAEILSKKYGVKILNLLERKTVLEQKKLNREERLGTSGAVYDILPHIKEDVKTLQFIPPKQVVLLDDIVTTGATMEKCAWLLKQAGIEDVYGLSLFIVD